MRIFIWDFEDRLASISGGGVPSTTYGYNGVGSRVSKSNTQGSRTYKRNGVGVTAPVLSDGVATMVPGISEKSGGVTSTILPDRMGSMKGLSSAGAVTETAEFDAFGKVIARTNPSATQKGFVGNAGYQEDGETGYKLLGHRYYDADTGRFLSRDPAFAGRNWYNYVDNNPLKAIDDEGLKKKMYIIIGTLGGVNDIRAIYKLVIYLQELYGDSYDVEIKSANSPEEFVRLMSECDAAAYIGHGAPPTTKGGVITAADVLDISRRRRKNGKNPLDVILFFSCNVLQGQTEADLWWMISDAVAGYPGDCHPAEDPEGVYAGLTWYRKPGSGYGRKPVWTDILPKAKTNPGPRRGTPKLGPKNANQ